MGCWNETCFLTRLPVFAGDKVKLLFVVPVPEDYRNTVHSNGWFMPINLPVSGDYDDYGGIESCQLEEPVLKVLSMIKFRIVKDRAKCEHDGVDLPEPDNKAAWQEMLAYLSSEARQGRLEAEINQPLNGGRTWLPVLPQMAHAWALEYLSCAGHADAIGYARTMSFRLSVAGPLRDALRPLEQREWPIRDTFFDEAEKPVIPLESAQELAGLMLSMEAMRLAFGPTCGSGSQDALDDGWQIEFCKQIFCRAASLPHRHDESEQAPFSMAVAWDGDNLHADRNNSGAAGTDLPETDDPDELRFGLISESVNCLLNAMEEAYEG